MTNKDTKASNINIVDKQYKLYDFIPEFSRFKKSDPEIGFNNESIGSNLFRTYKNGKIYFKSLCVRCEKCKKKDVVLNAIVNRKLIFLNIGEQDCLVQQFQCKNCLVTIPTDLSTIVKLNSNITYPVIKHILHLYAYFAAPLYKIQKSLKKEHNIKISHQTIENIILFSDFQLEVENWSLSGYYIFDALWVKKDGEWWYLICLFDVKINTIVSRSLVKSESAEAIENFLKDSLRNQKKKCVTTDLKPEYTIALDKMNINQQYCLFHTKQKINRDIKNYIKENEPTDDELKIIIDYKISIYRLLDEKDLEEAKNIRIELMKEINVMPEVIRDIMDDLIIPYFKKLTIHLEDENIESTSNKLENCFRDTFGKAIKKLQKSEDGILKRFDLRLDKWNEDNASF